MAIKIDIDKSSISGLREELIRLKSELSAATDPAQMQQLAQAAGQVQDKLNDVNEQVRTFAAGSQFEVAKNSLSGFGSALANLDFEKATQQANAFGGAIKGFNLSSLSNGIKGLTSSFGALGKAILGNPIFLIAAVIAAVVLSVAGLLEIFGKLTPVLDFIKEKLDAIKNGFIAFSDALGLTSIKADEAAQKQGKALDDLVKKTENKLAADIALYDAVEGLTEDEIKLLEKKLGVEIDSSKTSADARTEAYEKIRDEASDTFNKLDFLDRKRTEEEEKTYQDALETYRVYSNGVKELAIDKARAEIDATKKAEEDAAKLRDDASKKAAADAERAKALREKNAKEALDLLRDQNTLELLSVKETGIKRLETTKQQAEEEVKFLIENAKALNLITKQGDDTRLQLAIAAINERVQKEQQSYDQLEANRTAKVKEALLQRQAAELSTQQIIANNEVNNAKFTLDNFKGTTAERIVLINQVKDSVIAAIEAEKQAKLNAIQDEIDALQNTPTDETPEAQAARLAKIQEFEAQKKVIEDETRNAKTQADLDAIEQVKAANTQAQLESIANTQQYVAAAGQAIADFGSIAENIFAIQNEARAQRQADELAGLQEGTAAYKAALERQAVENDKAARKQFAIGKALQLANATVQGTQAVLAAFASGVATPIIGPATGAAFAAIAGAVAAANIAKIAATQYKGAGGGGSGGSVGTTGGGGIPTPSIPTATISGPAAPAVNLFGQGNNQNTVNASPNVVTGQPNITVTAVVSETDITSTQERVARMRRSAEL